MTFRTITLAPVPVVPRADNLAAIAALAADWARRH
jgi:hypothetical protein